MSRPIPTMPIPILATSGPSTANTLYVGEDDGRDAPGRLTFGVEIEFLCPVVPQGASDFHAFQDDRRVSRERPGREEGEFVFSALQRVPSITVEHKGVHHDGVTYNTWLFQPDDSVHLARSDTLGPYYMADGCEVSSEVLVAGEESSKDKIRAVCAAIRSERVLLNDTTAVHVHVGRGTRGFTLLTIKKLTSLLWLVDRSLMCLQHPSRLESEYCRMICEDSSLAAQASQASDLPGSLSAFGLQQMIEHLPRACRDAHEFEMTRIWGANNIEELRRLVKLNGCGYTTRGSVSYERFGPGKTNTVEFRHMGGSLEPEAITTWAELCVAIVEFARSADAPTFRFMMTYMMDLQTEPFDCAMELMRKLGFSEAAREYYEDKNDAYSRVHDWSHFEGQSRAKFVPPLPNSS